MAKEKTEGKFSAFCKSKNYFRLKLQIDRSHLKITGQVLAQAMPSDFIVITKTQAKFVEVKEILKDDRFVNVRFRQQYKLTKLAKHYSTDIMQGFLLLNFVKHSIVCYFKVDEYNLLLQNSVSKSLTLKQIPDRFKYTWKSLEL